jgi:alpha-tubulin suppressor-like RCC1 family protein
MNMVVGSSFGPPIPVYYLYSWGINSSGELGLGNTINRSSPNQIGASSTWSVIDGAWTSGSQAIKDDGCQTRA